MTEDDKNDTATANSAEDLRAETAEAAPELAEHDRVANSKPNSPRPRPR